MASEKLDPVRFALEIFAEIEKDVKSMKDESEVGSKLRTRAREGPELIRTMGLIPVLSFYYSKAREALQGKGGPEERAYMLYLKAILLYLDKIGIIGGASDIFAPRSTEAGEGAKSDLENIHSRLINILQDLSGKSHVAAKLLTPYLIEFKRLCEAVWESERG